MASWKVLYTPVLSLFDQQKPWLQPIHPTPGQLFTVSEGMCLEQLTFYRWDPIRLVPSEAFSARPIAVHVGQLLTFVRTQQIEVIDMTNAVVPQSQMCKNKILQRTRHVVTHVFLSPVGLVTVTDLSVLNSVT